MMQSISSQNDKFHASNAFVVNEFNDVCNNSGVKYYEQLILNSYIFCESANIKQFFRTR